MAVFKKGLNKMRLQLEKESEFDVASGNFDDLEIREGPDGKFHYFFDRRRNRLIKRFLLRDGARVDTLCDVVLISKDQGYTPRLAPWKRDKTEGSPDKPTEEALSLDDRADGIKARVDLDEAQDNFWKLIDFLRTYRGLVLPAHAFRVTSGDEALLLDAMEGQDKAAVLSAVRTYLRGEVTDDDVEMLRDRRQALERFRSLLHDAEFFAAAREAAGGPERAWQAFFEENTWIFGYGLTLVACDGYRDERLEQITAGRNVFGGGGKRTDALMKTKGFIETLLFAEIKTHETPLLARSPYRPPDVYQPSAELTGAVSQVQKTAHKAVKKLEDLHRQHRDTGEFEFEVSTIRPRQVVVAGQLDQLVDGDEVNVEKLTSFEMWRRGQADVEILTFDELYQRVRFIVEKQQPD
jgi:hypothetical protein